MWQHTQRMVLDNWTCEIRMTREQNGYIVSLSFGCTLKLFSKMGLVIWWRWDFQNDSVNETAASRSHKDMSMHLILSYVSLDHLDSESQATNKHVWEQKALGWAWKNEIYVNHDHHPDYSTYMYYCWHYLLRAFHVPGTELCPVPNIISFNLCNSSVIYILLLASLYWWGKWGSRKLSNFQKVHD